MSVSKTESSYLKFPSADVVLKTAGRCSKANIIAVREILEKRGLYHYIKPSRDPGQLRIDLGVNEIQDFVKVCPELYPYLYDKSDNLCVPSPEDDVQPGVSKMGLKGKFLSKKFHTSLEPLVQSLNKEAASFYRRIGRVYPVKCTLSLAALTSEKLMLKDIYKKQGFQGLCVGEYHQDFRPKQFIIDNLDTLKKLGVKTLFLEAIPYETMQPLLDEYFSSKMDVMPELLAITLERMDRNCNMKDPYSYTNLVRQAKKAGIRVVAIDTRVSCATHIWQKNRFMPTKRVQSMNYVANKIMQHEHRDGNFIALIGCHHTSTFQFGKGVFVPGVSDLMHCPTLSIQRSRDNKSHIWTNLRNVSYEPSSKLKHVQIQLNKP